MIGRDRISLRRGIPCKPFPARLGPVTSTVRAHGEGGYGIRSRGARALCNEASHRHSHQIAHTSDLAALGNRFIPFLQRIEVGEWLRKPIPSGIASTLPAAFESDFDDVGVATISKRPYSSVGHTRNVAEKSSADKLSLAKSQKACADVRAMTDHVR